MSATSLDDWLEDDPESCNHPDKSILPFWIRIITESEAKSVDVAPDGYLCDECGERMDSRDSRERLREILDEREGCWP